MDEEGAVLIVADKYLQLANRNRHKHGGCAVCVSDVKQYSNLVKTIDFLLRSFREKSSRCCAPLDNGESSRASTISPSWNASVREGCGSFHHTSEGVDGHLPKPSFLMSWRRRLPSSDEQHFFASCREKGLEVADLGSRVYLIFISKM